MDFEFFALLRNSIKYVELLAAITGTVYYYKYKNTLLKYFLIILWYTALNEFFAFTLQVYDIQYLNAFDIVFESTIYTVIIYNIFHFVNFSFLFLLFGRYLLKTSFKHISYTCLVIYVVSFFITMFFQNYIYEIQTIPFLIAAVSLIGCILLYFYQILNSNEVLHISKNLLFYISIGYLIYLVGSLPLRIIRNYFYEMPNLVYIINVSSILSILMNICFILGFICSEKRQQ